VHPFPNLGSEPEPFQLGSENSGGVSAMHSSVPGRYGGREEERVEKPGVFETKCGGGGNGCGGGDKERHVIRGRLRKRGQRRVRERHVPLVVKENPV
jgi:hypothetical protein